MKDDFVPINSNRTSSGYLFIHVQMNDQNVVTLWDPKGKANENKIYLDAMLQCLGDLYHQFTEREADQWKETWTCTMPPTTHQDKLMVLIAEYLRWLASPYWPKASPCIRTRTQK